MSNKEILAIADPHLGTHPEDVKTIIHFLQSQSPDKSRLLFLGDLFHIWAGPKKYHTEAVKSLLQELERFREEGGEAYLVTGNRDVLFPGKPVTAEESGLPFDLIAPDHLEFPTNGGKLIAFHGDTVNSMDRNYLRWRRLIRSRLFQWIFFHLIPAGYVKRIMFSLEKKLKQTNTAFRKEFPEEEWHRFIQKVPEEEHPTLVLAGHFHPSKLIIDRFRKTTGLVIPDWCENHVYLKIRNDFSYQLVNFKNGQLLSGKVK